MKLIKRDSPKLSLLEKSFKDTFSEFLKNFFDDDFFSTELVRSDFEPRVDVYEKNNNIVVKADIPGIDEKDLSVELEGNVLTISGKKEEEKEVKEKNYHRIERSYGSFCRSITLPDGIEADKISAEYKKGVLTVNIPKSKTAEAKKIEVKVS
ncbi:MAG: Hsp20/alpha crystallin family protein [Brevinematales bacterium]|nr:Hsp20/alpha crystallin family protein [Brevinematales bacterium]